MTKNTLKLAVAGAALAFGAAAHAQSINTTGATASSTDLLLFVSNSADTANFYSADLGITMDQLVTLAQGGAAADGSSIDLSGNAAGVAALNSAGNSTLAGFLSSHATGTTTFYLFGYDKANGTGTNNLATSLYANGNSQGLVLSTIPYTGATIGTNAALSGPTGYRNGIQGMILQLNGIAPYSTGALGSVQSVVSSSGVGDAAAGANGASSFGGNIAAGATVAVNGVASNTAANLFLMASSGTTGVYGVAAAKAINLGTLAMNAATGALTFTAAVTSVPLPAAVWLLGSGLFGLAGVGRRRQISA